MELDIQGTIHSYVCTLQNDANVSIYWSVADCNIMSRNYSAESSNTALLPLVFSNQQIKCVH